ncbi:MAG: hypothetical protein WAZ19_14510 [Anaerolineae bacterium]
MNTRRLGCLSGTGLLAGLLTLLIIAGLMWLRGGRMFSPGRLNTQTGAAPLGGIASHAESGGDCLLCHTAPWDHTDMAERCQACHTAIAADLTQPDTLHGALRVQGADMDCRACHTEHHGPTANLTIASIENFPHDVTGFALAAHTDMSDGASLACQDCHTDSLARFEVATCETCHRSEDAVFIDAHLAAFHTDCLSCHDGVDRFSRDRFDHSLFLFALTGQHEVVACASCHNQAHGLSDFQTAPTDCASCHLKDDAHDGQFGSDCAACHSTTRWQDATFDHSRTDFPLTGQHVNARCTQCHVNNVFRGTPTDCASCHLKDDAHDGQFGSDCAACHSTTRWQDATFDHSRTDFPLTGQHSEAECVQCHVNNVFRGTPTDCAACHVDPDFHRGAFGQTCSNCHNTTAWRPASFGRPHTFPMNHGGANSCRTCHTAQVQSYTCYTCHNAQEVEQEHREEGINDFQNCMQCHPTGEEGDDGGSGGGGGDDD